MKDAIKKYSISEDQVKKLIKEESITKNDVAAMITEAKLERTISTSDEKELECLGELPLIIKNEEGTPVIRIDSVTVKRSNNPDYFMNICMARK